MPFRNVSDTQTATVEPIVVVQQEPEKVVHVMFADDLPLGWMKAAVVIGLVNLGGLAFLIWEVVAHGLGK